MLASPFRRRYALLCDEVEQLAYPFIIRAAFHDYFLCSHNVQRSAQEHLHPSADWCTVAFLCSICLSGGQAQLQILHELPA